MKLLKGARVAVKEIRNEGLSESAVVANDGHVDQPLTGWSLASLQGVKVFRFEDGLVLRAGEHVTITSGQGVAHRPPSVYGWTDESVWNNRGDTGLIFDCDGEEVARYAYPISRAGRLGRLPKHRLVVAEDGTYRVATIRRVGLRDRPKAAKASK